MVLESVSAAKVSGPVALEQVRVRSADPAAGSLPNDAGTLPSSLSAPDGFKITQACETSNSTVSEMTLHVRPTGSGNDAVDGLTITYRSAGKRYWTSYPYTALLCDAAPQQTDEHCR